MTSAKICVPKLGSHRPWGISTSPNSRQGRAEFNNTRERDEDEEIRQKGTQGSEPVG